jgi:hypothetical protein
MQPSFTCWESQSVKSIAASTNYIAVQYLDNALHLFAVPSYVKQATLQVISTQLTKPLKCISIVQGYLYALDDILSVYLLPDLQKM